MCFSPDLFSLYNGAFPSKLENGIGFIIGRRNLDNIRRADDTVLMVDTSSKLQ